MSVTTVKNLGVASFAGPFNVAGLPRSVGADFLGMTFFNYPSGTSSSPYTSNPATPQFTYKTAVTWDFSGWGDTTTSWALIEKTQGSYTWGVLDSWVSKHFAAGASLYYQLACVPAFYSVNAASAPNSGYAAARLGAGGPLTTLGLSGISNFVSALIARYIAASTKFSGIEWWTEPDANQNLSSPTIGQGYWWGGVSTLIDMGYVVYRAAKEADATINVVGPGYFDPTQFVAMTSSAVKTMTLTALGTFAVGDTLTGATSGASGTVVAKDTANKIIGYTVTSGTFQNGENIQKSGATQGVSSSVNTLVSGYQTCDEYNIDTFNKGPPNNGMGVPEGIAVPINDDIVTWCNKYNVSYSAHPKNLNIMSCGIDAAAGPTVGSAATVNYLSQQLNSAWYYLWWMRTLMAAAALGVKRVNVYGYDGIQTMNQNWAGDMVGGTLPGSSGCIQAMKDIQSKVSGKTINAASYYNSGQVSLVFSDGSAFSV